MSESEGAASVASPLTPYMRDALRLLVLLGCTDAFVHAGPFSINDGGQAALADRTVSALKRRGLVNSGHEWVDDYGFASLTDKGRAVALALLKPGEEPARCECCDEQAEVSPPPT